LPRFAQLPRRRIEQRDSHPQSVRPKPDGHMVEETLVHARNASPRAEAGVGPQTNSLWLGRGAASDPRETEWGPSPTLVACFGGVPASGFNRRMKGPTAIHCFAVRTETRCSVHSGTLSVRGWVAEPHNFQLDAMCGTRVGCQRCERWR